MHRDPVDSWRRAIGERLHRLRLALPNPAEPDHPRRVCAVALEAGVHHSVMALWERAGRERLTLEPAYLLAQFYGVDLVDLLAEPGTISGDAPVKGRTKRDMRPWDPSTPSLQDLDAGIRQRLRRLRRRCKVGTPTLTKLAKNRIPQTAIRNLESGKDGVSLTRVWLLARALSTAAEAPLDTSFASILDWRQSDHDPDDGGEPERDDAPEHEHEPDADPGAGDPEPAGAPAGA